MGDLSSVVDDVTQLLVMEPVQRRPPVRVIIQDGFEFPVNDYTGEEQGRLNFFPNISSNLEGLGKIVNPNTPSHEISLGLLFITAYELKYFVPDRNKQAFDKLMRRVNDMMKQLGYKSIYYAMTFQEHTLAGSTSSPEYKRKPHVPQGVIDGRLTIEEANKARLLERAIQVHGDYFSVHGDFVKISLEPLDVSGKSIRDPRLLDQTLTPVPTTYRPDFPFRRL